MLTNFIKGIFKICTCVFHKIFWEEEQEENFADDEGLLSLLGKIISPFLLFYFMYNYSIRNASRYRRRRSRRFRQQIEPESTDSEDEESIASEFNGQDLPEMADYNDNNQDRNSYATMPNLRERSRSYTRSDCNFATHNSIEFRFNNIENFDRNDSPLGYSRSYDNLTPPIGETQSLANSMQGSHNLYTVNEEGEKSDDSGLRNSRAHSRSFRKRLTKHTVTTSVNEIKKTRTGTVYGRQHYL